MSTITDIAEPGPKVNHYILGLGLPVVQPTSDNPTARVWPVTAGAIGTFDRIVSIEMLARPGSRDLGTGPYQSSFA